MLLVDRIVASYGGISAVREVSLTVAEGEVASILGPNGAGKTTLMRVISGQLRPDSGRVTFAGIDITGWAAHRVARKGLILVPEGRQVFGSLTVEDNLRAGGFALERRPSKMIFRELTSRFPVLQTRLHQLAGSLSGGEQQMLAIGRGLMGAPRLLLLDEPSLGLAPKAVDSVYEQINALAVAGMTILLVEQSISHALEVATRVYVMKRGAIVESGAADQYRNDRHLIDAYL